MPSGPARRASRIIGLCLAVAASLSLGSAAGALTQHATVSRHTTHHPDLVKAAHVPLGNCTARDVIMRAQIPRLSYTARQPVTVAVVVHNVGPQNCIYGGTGGRYPEYMGPCGAFPLQVEDRSGTHVWPALGAYSCPAISATTLAPGGQVTATGTWPKAIVTRISSRGAPAGTYRLVIEQAITFTITLR
jgi:hypothetical protein